MSRPFLRGLSSDVPHRPIVGPGHALAVALIVLAGWVWVWWFMPSQAATLPPMQQQTRPIAQPIQVQ